MIKSAYSMLVVKKTPNGLKYYRKEEKSNSRSLFAGLYGKSKEKRAKQASMVPFTY